MCLLVVVGCSGGGPNGGTGGGTAGVGGGFVGSGGGLVAGGGGTGTAGGTTMGGGAAGGGMAGGATARGPFNTDISIPQASPQLATDGAGRIHLVSASAVPNAMGLSLVRYGACASDCDSPSSWRFLTLDEGTFFDTQVKLAVEPGGRVHVALQKTASVVYVTCASDCAAGPSAWSGAEIGLPMGYQAVSFPAGRAFGLSATGKPRVILNANVGAGPEVFVLGCDGTCTDGDGWNIDPLAGGKAIAASMAAGDPQQAVIALEQGFSVIFAQCSMSCGNAANWTQMPLMRANTNFISLVRGAGGELHLAWKSSLTVSTDETLYARCASGCAQAANWAVVTADPGENGRGGLDLAISSTGALAIVEADVVRDSQTLRWVTCSANCTQPGAWSGTQLEAGAAVTDPYSMLPGSACSNPLVFWAVGSNVQVVPSPTPGAFQLAYEATNYDKCLSTTRPSQIRARTVRLSTRSP